MTVKIIIDGVLFDPVNESDPSKKGLFNCADCNKSFTAPVFVWMMQFTLKGDAKTLMKDPLCASCVRAMLLKTQTLVHTAYISNNTKY